MNLDHFRLIRLTDAELLAARAAADNLKANYGNLALGVLSDILRLDLNAYATITLSTAQADRLALAKRIRAGHVQMQWLATTSPPPDEATLRAHLLAAMISAALEAKQQGHDPAKVLAELKRLGTEEGLAELRHLLARTQHLGITVEDVVYLDWVSQGQSRTGKPRWFNPQTHEYRYQTIKPGTRAPGQPGEVAQPTPAAAPTPPITPQRAEANLFELGDHISDMDVPALQAAHQKMQDWLIEGQKIKSEVVNSLKEYAVKKVAHAAAGPLSPEGVPADPRPGHAYNVPVKALKVDPERFQYKLNVNKEGVISEWKGIKKFNPEFAGVIAVWRDPATGQDFVVNGHHRYELAHRDNVDSMKVQYLDAQDAQEARAKGALINIAGGRGTEVDAAKFMRDTGTTPEEMEAKGVNLKAKMAENAVALTRLSDPLFDRVARGTLEVSKSLAVAKHLPNHTLQGKLFKLLDKREEEGKDIPIRNIEEMAREMAATPTTEKTESTLFGDITSTESLFEQRAEIKAAIRGELAKEALTFAAVGGSQRIKRLGEAGNVLDVEKNKQLGADAEKTKATYDTLVNRAGPISDEINKAAAELAQAKSKGIKDAIKQRAFAAVREAAATESSRKTIGTGAGEPAGLAPAVPEGKPGSAAAPPAGEPGRGAAAAPGLESIESPGFTADQLAEAKPRVSYKGKLGTVVKRGTGERVFVKFDDGSELGISAQHLKEEEPDKSPLYGHHGFPKPEHVKPPHTVERMQGLSPEDQKIEEGAIDKVEKHYDQLRHDYLKKNADFNPDGSLKSIAVNTDEWRELFPGYTGTNASAVHEPSSVANKMLLGTLTPGPAPPGSLLHDMKGKGNNMVAVYAGGGGSGKGTAIKQFFDETEYPIRVDQVTDNVKKANALFDKIKEEGYTPQYVFVDRPAAEAWGGVVGRAVNLRKKGKPARTVPIDVAMAANINARKTAIELLKTRLDIQPQVVDNTVGEKGERRLLIDRDEAVQFLEEQLKRNEQDFEAVKNKLRKDILDRHAAGEIPTDIARGLFGEVKWDELKKGAEHAGGGGISEPGQVPADDAGKPELSATEADRRAQPGRADGGVGGGADTERTAESSAGGAENQIRAGIDKTFAKLTAKGIGQTVRGDGYSIKKLPQGKFSAKIGNKIELTGTQEEIAKRIQEEKAKAIEKPVEPVKDEKRPQNVPETSAAPKPAKKPELPEHIPPVGHENADFTPDVKKLDRGELGMVGGYPIRRIGEDEYRMETDLFYATGTAEEMAARLKRNWADMRPERTKVAHALARGDANAGPDFTDEKGMAADAAARKALPDRTRVVSLDPKTRGRVGTLRQTMTSPVVKLDNSSDVAVTDFEPLDEKLSWRAGEKKAEAEKPKAVTPGMFPGEEKAAEEKPAEKPAELPKIPAGHELVDSGIVKKEDAEELATANEGKVIPHGDKWAVIRPEQPEGVQHGDQISKPDELAGEGGEGPEGRLQPEEPVGEHAAAPPAEAIPGAGEAAGAGPGIVPPSPDEQRDAELRPADGARLESRVGAGTGPSGPPAGSAGGAGSRGILGAGGSRGVDDERRADVPPEAVSPPTPHEEIVSAPPSKENPTDTTAGNFRYTDREFAAGGAKTKFWNNVAAIRTLQAIQAEGRNTATPEEQAIMSKFVGWGQFPAVFNIYGAEGEGWKKERETLRGLLSHDDWQAASASKLNAHFTSPDVVDAHWKMAERLGFKGGRFLETSAGIGYYLGQMPPELAGKTRASAVELDTTTGNMLKLLYPAANVEVTGFEKFQAPPGFYDLVASNVPFGDYKVHDPDYNRHQANIHDYFFLKSVDKVRPGGLVMHITSTGTLDKADDKIRQELAKKCDLVGAIRFPGQTHKENAGTDVVTDMLILRRRLPGEQPNGTDWMKTVMVPDPAGGEPIPVNKYFADHPEQILGTLDRTGTMYRGGSVNVSKTEDYEQRLAAAIERLPANIMKKQTIPADRIDPKVMPAPGDVKDRGFKVEGGKVYIRDGGALVEHEISPAKLERLQAHLELRDAAREALNEQLNGRDATGARENLNKVYDAFVKKHGYLNDLKNKQVFRTDPDSPFLLALEKYDPKTKKGTKADIFRKDTVRAIAPATHAGTVPEALGISLHESGGVDVERMAKLTGQPLEAVGKHLVDNGLAFEDPGEGWKPADQYLSGNVRQKLTMAKAAAAADPKYKANVAALEKVQPEDIEYDEIEAKLGSPWVPPDDVAAFAGHLLGIPDPKLFTIGYLRQNGEWQFDFKKSSAVGRVLAHSKGSLELWSTPRKGFDDLFEAACNGSPVTVYDEGTDAQGNKTRILNHDATKDAEAKVQEMKDAFKDWLWADDERRTRLHRFYNDNFNNIRHMKYDGSHLKFPGMDPSIKLHKHIPDFVWQVVTTGKGLAAHEVGTGKTYAMISSAMELRRLGLAKKPAIACLKANIEAITNDCIKLYPGAKILSTVDMFDAAKRKKTISQIATGDYDIIIMTHDNLNMLQMKPDTIKGYIQEELDELEAAKAAAYEENPKKDNRIVAALNKAKKNLEAKLLEALDASKKDDAIFFEETGIDQLFVDEAHKYKSLPAYSKQRIKGIPTTRSDRATAMLMRTRWLQEQNNGRGVVFATGTPVANTMAELYNLQRYLQPKELKARGLEAFDAWANTFAETNTSVEVTATGEYKPVTRLNKFVNLPELMQMARQMMDVQRIDKMPESVKATIIRPKRHDDVAKAPHSDAIAGLMRQLQQRAKDLDPRAPEVDNMLKICTDGRKGSIDMRLLGPEEEDNPQSKTNMAVERMLKVHKADQTRTQLIFSDMGVHPTSWGFHLYGDIIDKLVKGGIPREKIADFSQLEGAKKEAAQEAMRQGEIVIGIGSTDKLGTGVNVQNRLKAIHHLDVPWLPAHVEQRNGRGYRHGNQNKDLDIVEYVTEGSLDQFFWQLIENKTRFIEQVMTQHGDTGKETRTVNDEDTEQLSPEQLKAAASGDPRVMELVQIHEDVRNLDAARKRHDREQARLRDSIKTAEYNLPKLEETAKRYAGTVAVLEKHPDFLLEIDGKKYDEQKAGVEAFDAKSAKLDSEERPRYGYYVDPDEEKHIGKFRGLDLIRRGQKHYLVHEGIEIPTGASMASVATIARFVAKKAAEAEAEAKKAKIDADKMKEATGKTFTKADELKKKQERAKELEKALSGKDKEEENKEAANAA